MARLVPGCRTPALGSDAAGTTADGATDRTLRGSEAPEPTLPRDTMVGRYTVARLVGTGAMGEVYAAVDPQLDRQVALKLMRTRVNRSMPPHVGHARMLREAQALARLSHPNVVPIYDVGVFEDRVFVAMELVHGQTLRRWAADPMRGWSQIIEVMLGAGEGLAAAHDAGLVHRDFKPDNVLIDAEDHGRVMDFGLVRGLTDDEGEPTGLDIDGAGLCTTLTMAGSVMGTPSYMAPEQHAGARVDERCDQFAFCVTLYELLHGIRPYAGCTNQELSRNKWAQRRRDYRDGPHPERVIPRRVNTILARGLMPRPKDRWPSMRALLDALRASLRPPVRSAWLGGAGLALAIGGLFAMASGPTRLCADGPTCHALGQQHLGRGEPAAAIEAIEHARALAGESSDNAVVRADLDFLLAQALHAADRDPLRARLLAEAAARTLRHSPRADPRLLGEVEAWLAAEAVRLACR